MPLGLDVGFLLPNLLILAQTSVRGFWFPPLQWGPGVFVQISSPNNLRMWHIWWCHSWVMLLKLVKLTSLDVLLGTQPSLHLPLIMGSCSFKICVMQLPWKLPSKVGILKMVDFLIILKRLYYQFDAELTNATGLLSTWPNRSLASAGVAGEVVIHLVENYN